MPRPVFARSDAVIGTVAAVMVALILLVALLVARPAGDPAAAGTEAPSSAAPRALVLGDSWTYGSATNPRTMGYAYVAARQLGWNAVIDGARGSGYLRPSIEGGTFGDRIQRLDPALDPDIVVVQGSINDRIRVPEGYVQAVTAAWDALAELYPKAQIVILGPAPQLLPVETGTTYIDEQLALLSAARGWAYISPLQSDWITPQNYVDVIDTSVWGANHPSTAGHAYLARRLVEALTALTTTAGGTAVGSP